MSDIAIYSLVKDKEGFLYSRTKNGYLYRSTNPVISFLDIEKEFDSYYLSQNYPNPFNPFTTVEYSVPKKENVKLTIFDILGRELIVLVNKIQDEGMYKVNFNAYNLCSDVYIYKIEAGNFSQTKHMILLK